MENEFPPLKGGNVGKSRKRRISSVFPALPGNLKFKGRKSEDFGGKRREKVGKGGNVGRAVENGGNTGGKRWKIRGNPEIPN